MKEIQPETKTTIDTVKQIAGEVTLTILVLGFILSGLLGGADLTGHIELPASWQRYVGGFLIGYVLVGMTAAVHFGIKFLTRKK